MNNVAVRVPDDLEFNMVRAWDELFDVNVAVPKGLFRLQARRVKCRHKGSVIVRHAHAPTTTTCGGFDHDRIANLLRHPQCRRLICHDSIAPGSYWHAG